MSCDRRLKGRVALISGATSGLGRAIALRFAREGVAVRCMDVRRNPDPTIGDDPDPPVDEVLEKEGRITKGLSISIGQAFGGPAARQSAK